jgi:hypothetical protein
MLSADEAELVLLGLVTLLAQQQETGDIFEEGYEGIAAALLERLRKEVESLGIMPKGTEYDGR